MSVVRQNDHVGDFPGTGNGPPRGASRGLLGGAKRGGILRKPPPPSSGVPHPPKHRRASRGEAADLASPATRKSAIVRP